MLKFENWPPTPGKVHLTEDALRYYSEPNWRQVADSCTHYDYALHRQIATREYAGRASIVSSMIGGLIKESGINSEDGARIIEELANEVAWEVAREGLRAVSEDYFAVTEDLVHG